MKKNMWKQNYSDFLFVFSTSLEKYRSKDYIQESIDAERDCDTTQNHNKTNYSISS